MAHKVRKHHARFFARTRPNKKSRKHPAQSMRDREIFLRMKEKESAQPATSLTQTAKE